MGMEPQKQELGKLPQWLQKNLQGTRYESLCHGVLPHQVFDHYGTITVDGEERFVCDPYVLTLADFTVIRDFIDEARVDFVGHGKAAWNEACLRLEFVERER
jgi:hypothetical protein